MEKKYITPETVTTKIELQQILAGSPKMSTEETEAEGIESKRFGFFFEEERAEKNEYKVYSLWED